MDRNFKVLSFLMGRLLWLKWKKSSWEMGIGFVTDNKNAFDALSIRFMMAFISSS
jgi:hypothetical protein